MTFPEILRQVPDSGSGGSISEIASPSGDAAPAEPSSTPSGGGSEQSVEEVLRFDMFAPPEKPKPAEGQPAPAPGQPAPAAAAQPATPQPATTPQGQLEQLLATQTAQINEVLRRQQEATKPTAPAATPPAAAAPRFQVGVPPQLVQMLRSEDQEEVGRGVHALVNGVSNMVWDAVQEHIQKEVMGQIPNIIQQHYTSRQEVQSIENDFYGRYSHVANDAFRPIIQQIGLQLINDLAARGLPTHYTPQVGDIIIQRLHALIPQLGPVPTGPRQAAPAPTGAKPKLNGAGGTRPSATTSLADEILGTIRS